MIIGPLGAGKSSLAYTINKKFNLPRLNLDEVCRKPDSSYYTHEESFAMIDKFISQNSSWVAEGCQKHLFERLLPDLIVDMRINHLVAIWRFTYRFIKAKKLIGKTIDKDLPVQAYHYRKPTFVKILDWTKVNLKINSQINIFLKKSQIKIIKCKSYSDYNDVFRNIKGV